MPTHLYLCVFFYAVSSCEMPVKRLHMLLVGVCLVAVRGNGNYYFLLFWFLNDNFQTNYNIQKVQSLDLVAITITHSHHGLRHSSHATQFSIDTSSPVYLVDFADDQATFPTIYWKSQIINKDNCHRYKFISLSNSMKV